MVDNAIAAGFSRVEITPPLDVLEVYGLGYWYERKIRFTGVRDPLYVRAAAIGNGKSTQIFISIDAIFDSYGFISEAVSRIHAALDLPAENILVTCTHTHSSPLIGNNNTNRGIEYGAYVAERLASAAELASRNRKTLVPAVSRRRVSGVVRNRRPLLKSGHIAELHTESDAGAIADPGLVNDVLTLVKFRDLDGTLVGGFCHFGIHGVSIQCSDLISSDCIGRAIQQFESGTGASSVLLHLNGPCGDIDPVAMGDAAALGQMSQRLFAALQAAADGEEAPLTLTPQKSSAHRFRVARRRARSADELQKARRLSRVTPETQAPRHHSGQGYQLFLLNEEEAVGAMPAEIEIGYQLLGMGELLWVGVGGEIFTSTGLELAEKAGSIRVLPIGITGRSNGYLPPAHAYAQGGYEVACARWCPIACGETEKLFARIGEDVSAMEQSL
jgi:neutral ceramidase